jgi:hypothetical protein
VVPTFTTNRSTREMPSYIPAASPRVRRSLSSWPPHRSEHPGSGVARPVLTADAHDTPTQIHQVRVGSTLTGLHALVPLVHLLVSLAGPAPSGSADAPSLSGLLPTLPGVSRIRLSSASARLLRQPSGKGLPPLLGHTGASWRTNRSSKRRPASATAHRCSLACIRSTRAHASVESMGHATPVFTSVTPSPSSRAAILLGPFPKWPASRPRSTTGPPPRPDPIDRPCIHPNRCAAGGGRPGEPERFPRSSANPSTGSAPSYAPAPSPRLRRRPSPWPPRPATSPSRGVPRQPQGIIGCAVRSDPCPPGFGSAVVS